MSNSFEPYPRRYGSIDAWRGVASLAVLFWHRYWLRTTVTDGFWLGVQMFFVISGYCIAAAVDNAHEKDVTFRQFMGRRLRRIGVPYLGSLFLACVVRYGLAASRDGIVEGLSYLKFPPSFWAENLTLTQWLYLTRSWLSTGEGLWAPWYNPHLLLGVHWSLNYEEQFYLLAGVLLLLTARARPRMLIAAFTMGTCVLNICWPGRITGLFVDYWMQFFCGVALFIRLTKLATRRSARLFDAVALVFSLGILGAAIARHEFPLVNGRVQFFGQLSFCAFYALLLLSLRPLDRFLSASAAGMLLRSIGRFSYSLYLVHRPALEALADFDAIVSEHLGILVADAVVLLLVVLFAYIFFIIFERPFLNPPLERLTPSRSPPQSPVEAGEAVV